MIKDVCMIMDNTNSGIVYINSHKKIESCNQRAKEITGIVFDKVAPHPAGKIEEGDIVILSDINFGEDDGGLCHKDLEIIGIKDKNIKNGGILMAIGVYKNDKIKPVYKTYNEIYSSMLYELNNIYLGFDIKISIDNKKKIMHITVNDIEYPLMYFSSIGHIVVLDSATGRIKFYQARGYSVRNESIASLLRGNSYQEKSITTIDKSTKTVEGEIFHELFDSNITEELYEILNGKDIKISDKLYEINKRLMLCSLVPNTWDQAGKITGAYLIFKDASSIDQFLRDRDKIISQIERNHQIYQKHMLKTNLEDISEFDSLYGESSQMQNIKYLAKKASSGKFNVLILGESGTGKTLLAREIHNLSSPKKPFVVVNCNAIAPSLIESELFGYVGGAFTGAKSQGSTGFFEEASGGTIFLDEIGELSLDMQVKLLHVLQDKTIYKVGSSKPTPINVRVIAATNKNLQHEVEHGKFRQDLYYRLNVFPIEIPPLRDRKEDIYILINQICKKICKNYDIEQKSFSGDAMELLFAYNWPGNIRELENIIERAIILSDSNLIYPEHITIPEYTKKHTLSEIMETYESKVIKDTLINTQGNKTKAMEVLDISKSSFYEKLKKYNIK